jgi:beta-glucanase (GH16 family)
MLIIFLFISPGCKKKSNDPDFTVNFSYSFQDDNHIQFNNESEGEYYFLIWDFGNDVRDTTTDKKKSYEIYYPQAGDFTVSLRLQDYYGNTGTTSQTINITNNDLLVSFTADIDPDNPNYVTLKNTTAGEFDSFKWLYRNREVEDEMEFEAYFPYAANYEVEIQVYKEGYTFSQKESISILEDDPEYPLNLPLTWSDEFDGTAVNQDYWSFDTGADGWGNEELQNYTDGENVEMVDGKLVITARKVDDNQGPGSYTSARVNTQGKKEFRYGRLEIRAKLPSGTGIWPAIWMLGSNFSSEGWPACGEMDIMEYVGYQPNTVHSTVHTPAGFGDNGDGSSFTLETCEEEFHNYGLIWTESKLLFYVDTPDNIIHTYAPVSKTEQNWPFDQPAFFLLNVAVGGTWGGAQGIDDSIFPQSMEIDYVRVYQETGK